MNQLNLEFHRQFESNSTKVPTITITYTCNIVYMIYKTEFVIDQYNQTFNRRRRKWKIIKLSLRFTEITLMLFLRMVQIQQSWF